ncbi:hypothetical protein JCM10207_004058 [Rhodosporidiobolus poonsookiae]
MLVHCNETDHTVTLEEHDAFLELTEQSPDAVAARFFPSSGADKPDLTGCTLTEAVGCLGILRYKGSVFVVVAVGPELPVHDVCKIYDVLFFDLTGQHEPVAKFSKHPCFHLREVLSDGSLHYSREFDITTRLESRLTDRTRRQTTCDPVSRRDLSHPPPPPPSFSGTPKLTWNHFLLEPLRRFYAGLSAEERDEWHTRSFAMPLMRGAHLVREFELGGQRATLTIISRKGWGRDGTRLAKRGVDDAGNVGNFAETETLLETSTHAIAFVQVRGSVPLKWQEPAIWTGPSKVHIDQPLANVSLIPFAKHFSSLLASYRQVHILSFMTSSRTGYLSAERALGEAYRTLYRLASPPDSVFARNVIYEHFEVRQDGTYDPVSIGGDVQASLGAYGATVVRFDARGRPTVIAQQEGTFRVNCRECCDRTGLGAFSLSSAALSTQLKRLGLLSFAGSELEKVHRDLFAANNDIIAYIYAGSPAMNSRFIRTGMDDEQQKKENHRNWEMRKKQYELHDKDKNKATEVLTGQYRKQELLPVLLNARLAPAPCSSSDATALPTPPPPRSLPRAALLPHPSLEATISSARTASVSVFSSTKVAVFRSQLV